MARVIGRTKYGTVPTVALCGVLLSTPCQGEAQPTFEQIQQFHAEDVLVAAASFLLQPADSIRPNPDFPALAPTFEGVREKVRGRQGEVVLALFVRHQATPARFPGLDLEALPVLAGAASRRLRELGHPVHAARFDRDMIPGPPPRDGTSQFVLEEDGVAMQCAFEGRRATRTRTCSFAQDFEFALALSHPIPWGAGVAVEVSFWRDRPGEAYESAGFIMMLVHDDGSWTVERLTPMVTP